MRKVKLFTAVCLALFAGALMAAPEPTVPAAPAVDQAIREGVKTVVEKKNAIQLPATAVRNATSSDELIGWYIDPATQMRYMVYEWEKPAVVNSLTMAANQKVAPGREIMILVPQGRSKGKFKIDIAAKVAQLAPGFKPSAVVEPGTVMAVFQPIEVAHDSVSNTTVVGGGLPGWGEAMKGLWQSTGIYDIINQSSSDFKSTWILGLGRVLMMLVALVLIYLAIVKEFEPLLLLQGPRDGRRRVAREEHRRREQQDEHHGDALDHVEEVVPHDGDERRYVQERHGARRAVLLPGVHEVAARDPAEVFVGGERGRERVGQHVPLDRDGVLVAGDHDAVVAHHRDVDGERDVRDLGSELLVDLAVGVVGDRAAYPGGAEGAGARLDGERQALAHDPAQARREREEPHEVRCDHDDAREQHDDVGQRREQEHGDVDIDEAQGDVRPQEAVAEVSNYIGHCGIFCASK